MTERFRLAGKAKGADDDAEDSDNEEGKEPTLTAFSGTCYKCIKKGHKANKCPDNQNSGGGNKRKPRFQGNCNLCARAQSGGLLGEREEYKQASSMVEIFQGSQ